MRTNSWPGLPLFRPPPAATGDRDSANWVWFPLTPQPATSPRPTFPIWRPLSVPIGVAKDVTGRAILRGRKMAASSATRTLLALWRSSVPEFKPCSPASPDAHSPGSLKTPPTAPPSVSPGSINVTSIDEPKRRENLGVGQPAKPPSARAATRLHPLESGRKPMEPPGSGASSFHGHMDPSGDGFREAFVVASETAAPHEPTEGPFHYPAFRRHF